MPVLSNAVPRRAGPNDEQIALRLPKEWIARAEQLRDVIAAPGVTVTVSDVLRATIARGLTALEEERDRPTSTPAKKTKKR